MQLFKRLFSSLARESVEYMVAGGIAVNLYGIERATADIDLVVSLEEGNLLRFMKVAKTLELKPRLPVTLDDFVDETIRRNWILSKGMMVFSLYDTKNPFFLTTKVSLDDQSLISDFSEFNCRYAQYCPCHIHRHIGNTGNDLKTGQGRQARKISSCDDVADLLQ